MRKKSSYRPKRVLVDPVAWVINGFKPLSSIRDQHSTLLAKTHAAMDELVRGRGTRYHVDVMVDALNMAEALAGVKRELGEDWKPEIEDAQVALKTMAERGICAGNRYIFRSEEMKAINLALQVHDEQLAICTIGQLEEAMHVVIDGIKKKNAMRIQKAVAA